MANKHTVILREQRNKAFAKSLIDRAPFDPVYQITMSEYHSRRTLEQNAKMWAMLTDISRQVEWHGVYLPKETWKEMITAALKQQETVPGIEGGFVVIGASTSKMTIREMGDVIEYAYAFGSGKGVKWSEPVPEEYR